MSAARYGVEPELAHKSMHFEQASVHGRFQMFHNGHLEYLLEAKRRCDYLWVGITQYDIFDLRSEDLAIHRGLSADNPFTYYERVQMISDALCDSGLSRTVFGFVPFPIENEGHLPNFLPVTIPCLTTIYDHWNREKVKRLRELGYHVVVLWERDKKITEGSEVRRLLRSGSADWMDLVPNATIRAVERYDLRQRLLDHA